MGFLGQSSRFEVTVLIKLVTMFPPIVVLYSCRFLVFGTLCLNDDYAFHNAHNDEDQNIDLPYGQLDDNVGIYESSLELE
jgi:hypothetical protein